MQSRRQYRGEGLCQKEEREGCPRHCSVTPCTQEEHTGGRLGLHPGLSLLPLEDSYLCWPQILTPRTLTIRLFVQEIGR